MEPIVDSHAHLNDDVLINDIENIKNNMNEFGVSMVLIPGWDIKSSIDAINISNNFDGFYAAIGIHPENIDGLELDDIDKIKDLSKNNKVIAIGEIGLDYHYTKDNKEQQILFFKKQLSLALELDLPVVIHMRDCTEDLLNVVKEFKKENNLYKIRGIMHSFSGSIETMNEFLKLGFYISFSGPVTFKNARQQKECAINCPMDRILVETDSPYLTPEPFRGKRNEPKNVYFTLKYISELRGESIDSLADATTNNFKKLFRLEK